MSSRERAQRQDKTGRSLRRTTRKMTALGVKDGDAVHITWTPRDKPPQPEPVVRASSDAEYGRDQDKAITAAQPRRRRLPSGKTVPA